MCFVRPNCPASVSASTSSLAFYSCSLPSFYCLSFYFHIYKWSTHSHTHTHTYFGTHSYTRQDTHQMCLAVLVGWQHLFFESSLGNILEKGSKKKSVFFTCVIWLSASLRPLQFRFCLKKGHFIFIKETKYVPSL